MASSKVKQDIKKYEPKVKNNYCILQLDGAMDLLVEAYAKHVSWFSKKRKDYDVSVETWLRRKTTGIAVNFRFACAWTQSNNQLFSLADKAFKGKFRANKISRPTKWQHFSDGEGNIVFDDLLFKMKRISTVTTDKKGFRFREKL